MHSWGALTPQVPADNWGGRGWTLWQTARCGKVRGITGCIRTDVYNGGESEVLTGPDGTYVLFDIDPVESGTNMPRAHPIVGMDGDAPALELVL